MTNGQTIINRIEQIRDKEGLTNNAFANRCDINTSNFAQVMKGHRSVSVGMLYSISKAFNVAMEWLEDGIGDMLCCSKPTIYEHKDILPECHHAETEKDDTAGVIERITSLRMSRGLSIREFADICGVNSSNLSRSLAGKAPISQKVMHKIAIAFNVPLEWVMRGDDSLIAKDDKINQPQEELNQIKSAESIERIKREHDIEVKYLKEIIKAKDEEIAFLRQLITQRK